MVHFRILSFLLVPVVIGQTLPKANLYRKCCPERHGIMRMKEHFSENTYKCVDIEAANLYVNGTAGGLLVGSKNELMYGFPEGCTTNMKEDDYRAVSYSSEVHCLDKVLVEIENASIKERKEVIALRCEAEESARKPRLEIEKIRKCCRDGFAYDVIGKVCRKTLTGETMDSVLRSFIGNDSGLYDIHIGLVCKADQSSIPFTEEKYEMEYHNRRLLLRNKETQEEQSMWREEYCVDKRWDSEGLVVRGCLDSCQEGVTCVRKCCPIGEHHIPRVCGRGRNVCVPSEYSFNPAFYTGRYLAYKKTSAPGIIGVRSPPVCELGRFALNNSSPDDESFLFYSGELIIPKIYKFYPTDNYCLENVDRTRCGGKVEVEVVLCFEEATNLPYKFTISLIGISISCVCLIFTMLVYIALPELRNLHGMTLMCHVGSMLAGYGCLARVQLGHIDESTLCKVLGYMIYFSFSAAFSWLCVMCFDIWWTFGSVKTVQRIRKPGADGLRFLWYSLCAWGAPISLTVTMLMLDLYPISPFLDANIGANFCWFGSIQNDATDWPHYIFFVVPMGLVTGVNLILWIATARHCARVKSELHRMQAGSMGDRAKRRFQADRAKYTLVGKLWVVMGAGWVWEVLSTVVAEPRWLWLGVDLINELQGFFIFAILVLKPKVFFLIRKKLGLEKIGAQAGGGAGTTSTRSTFLSTRSMSSDERTQLRISNLAPALERLNSRFGKKNEI